MDSTILFAHRHGQEHFPARPIFHRFPASVQKNIRVNPLGTITFAAQCLADKEALFDYVDSLSIPEKLRREIRNILVIEYNLNKH